MSSELEELQKLGLISKICSELDNHLGFSDKTLAEFIIHLAEESIAKHGSNPSTSLNDRAKAFHSVLVSNDADFSETFAVNLYRIIESILNKKAAAKKETVPSLHRNEKDELFPGLAKMNTQPIKLEIESKKNPPGMLLIIGLMNVIVIQPHITFMPHKVDIDCMNSHNMRKFTNFLSS